MSAPRRGPDETRADIIAAHYLEALGAVAALRLAEEIVQALKAARRNELLAAADQIDRGPTFPLPPSVISALVRERAADLGADE